MLLVIRLSVHLLFRHTLHGDGIWYKNDSVLQLSESDHSFEGLDALGRFFTSFDKGDNFYDFLFAFLHTMPLLKRCWHLKERICSPGEQILTIYSSGAVGSASDWWSEGRGFDPRRVLQHSFVEIDHELFSSVILTLPLIQEWLLSISGERIAQILTKPLWGLSLPRKSVVR